jgi:hypothetical protein
MPSKKQFELKEISVSPASPTYNDIVNNGPAVLPQQRIQIYDDKEWEQFTEECAYSLKQKYKNVRRVGGAGDQGIDIVAFKTDIDFDGKWDNYQCKHYDHPLHPSDVYLELGKLCYYTFIKSYTVPENYYFIAPQGIGTSLGKLIRGNHSELKRLFIGGWEKYCQKKITSKNEVILTEEFKQYIEAFDFSIIKDISLLELGSVDNSHWQPQKRTSHSHYRDIIAL